MPTILVRKCQSNTNFSLPRATINVSQPARCIANKSIRPRQRNPFDKHFSFSLVRWCERASNVITSSSSALILPAATLCNLKHVFLVRAELRVESNFHQILIKLIDDRRVSAGGAAMWKIKGSLLLKRAQKGSFSFFLSVFLLCNLYLELLSGSDITPVLFR